MLFEWDDAKYKANIQKHGIGFQDAAKIFAAPHTLTSSKQSGRPLRYGCVYPQGQSNSYYFSKEGT